MVYERVILVEMWVAVKKCLKGETAEVVDEYLQKINKKQSI
jgi:hypothetical protein